MVLKDKKKINCRICNLNATKCGNVYRCPQSHSFIMVIYCNRCGEESNNLVKCYSGKHHVCQDCKPDSHKYLSKYCHKHSHLKR